MLELGVPVGLAVDGSASGLAEVGVEPDPQIPGQQGGLTQQLRRDAEGGAGGQGHHPHGEGGGIVVEHGAL